MRNLIVVWILTVAASSWSQQPNTLRQHTHTGPAQGGRLGTVDATGDIIARGQEITVGSMTVQGNARIEGTLTAAGGLGSSLSVASSVVVTAQYGPDSSTMTMQTSNGLLGLAHEIFIQSLTKSANGSNTNKNGFGGIVGMDAVTAGVTGQEGVFTCAASSGSSVNSSTTAANSGCTFSMRGRVSSAVTAHRGIYGIFANTNWTATDQSTYHAWNVTPSGTIIPLTVNPMVLTQAGELDLRSNGSTVQTWGSQAAQSEAYLWDASGNSVWKTMVGGAYTFWQNSVGTQLMSLSNGGALVAVGSATFQGGARLEGGLTLSAGVVNSTGIIHNIATNTNFNATGTNTTLSAGTVSTITFTTGNNPVRCHYSGSVESVGSVIVGGCLVDGGFISGFSNIKGHNAVHGTGSAVAMPFAFQCTTAQLTAAQHSIALMFMNTGGSTWHACNSMTDTDANGCEFSCEELK